MKIKRLLITLVLGLGLTIALLWLLSGPGTRLPVARAADLHVCPSGCAYSSIQAAVDAASDGDVIKVAAGTYTGVQGRPAPPGYPDPPASGIISQVVYISKTITIQGGYTTTNWTTSYPITQTTTLDAQEQGRVLFITGDITPTVEGLHITGGNGNGLGGMSGEDAGGGIYVITAAVTISNNRVFGNTGDRCGGGLYILDSGGVRLSQNIISGNESGTGGGLHLRKSPNAVLEANTIRENRANQGGGLYLHLSSGATLVGNTFISNTSIGYGVNFGGGAFIVSSDNVTLTGNVIRGNWVEDGGGGLWLANCNTLELADNVISDNHGSRSGGRGGGLNFFTSDYVELRGNRISNNNAARGGGLRLQNSVVTLTNNIVADNEASVAGSGLYVEDSSAQLLHTTIAHNIKGEGSGVYITGTVGTMTLTNTILVSHTVGITVAAGNTAILNGVLWYSNTINYGGEGSITVTNEYTGGPAFAADGYHLTAGSAAIDRNVVNAGVNDDIDGEPRPAGTNYDLGADEYYHPALDVTKQAEPELVQAGEPLTYTLHVTNTGNVDLHATVTDTLPAQVRSKKTLTWTPTITAPGGVWTQLVTVTVRGCYAGPLTNVVQVTTIEGATGVYTAETLATFEHCIIYLSLVLRNH